MSGSSGPDLTVGGGGAEDDCRQLQLTRWLQGLVPGVADQLTVGAILDVALHEGPPPVVALTTNAGEVAGSVVPIGRLLECLRQGVRYVAEVRSGDPGAVLVDIQAAT